MRSRFSPGPSAGSSSMRTSPPVAGSGTAFPCLRGAAPERSLQQLARAPELAAASRARELRETCSSLRSSVWASRRSACAIRWRSPPCAASLSRAASAPRSPRAAPRRRGREAILARARRGRPGEVATPRPRELGPRLGGRPQRRATAAPRRARKVAAAPEDREQELDVTVGAAQPSASSRSPSRSRTPPMRAPRVRAHVLGEARGVGAAPGRDSRRDARRSGRRTAELPPRASPARAVELERRRRSGCTTACRRCPTSSRARPPRARARPGSAAS